ncbi:MAG: DUF1624 domain-containing protein [Betaproteobacteria bacterium]|nr:DUF1624 domain-containing protein [Betaproteobacteria bacterium]
MNLLAALRGKDSDNTPRLALIDTLRGGALLLMVLYHLGFDLNYLGWIHFDINYDWRWLTARALILGSFLWIAGVSLALAEAQQKTLQRKLLRTARIALAAGLVTAGSRLFIPDQTIYFGTLHAIALMSLVIQLCPLPAGGAGLLGLVVIGLGSSFAHTAFDFPGLAWLGLMTYKPLTADYVPMLPWFGVCLIGYAWAKVFLAGGPEGMATKQPQRPAIAWLGRHSLAVYLIHQPLLLGIMMPLTRLLRPL